MLEFYLVALLVLLGATIALGSFWVQRSERASWFDSVALSVFLVMVYSGLVMFAFALYADDNANGTHIECEATGINESVLKVRMQNYTEFVSCSEVVEAFMEADLNLIRSD